MECLNKTFILQSVGSQSFSIKGKGLKEPEIVDVGSETRQGCYIYKLIKSKTLYTAMHKINPAKLCTMM